MLLENLQNLMLDVTNDAYESLGLFFLGFMLFILIFVIFIIVTQWKIFEKAGRSEWHAIIPFYNV